MSENQQDVTQEEAITFADFKSWLVVMIRNKGGDVPDIEDWKEIKAMMDRVGKNPAPVIFGWDHGRDDGYCRSPSPNPFRFNSDDDSGSGHIDEIPDQKFIESQAQQYEPRSFSYGPVTVAGEVSHVALTPIIVPALDDDLTCGLKDLIDYWEKENGSKKEKN